MERKSGRRARAQERGQLALRRGASGTWGLGKAVSTFPSPWPPLEAPSTGGRRLADALLPCGPPFLVDMAFQRSKHVHPGAEGLSLRMASCRPDWMGPGDKLTSEGWRLHQALPSEVRGSQSPGNNSYYPSPSESHHVRGQGRDAVSHVAGAGARLAVRCLRSFSRPLFPSQPSACKPASGPWLTGLWGTPLQVCVFFLSTLVQLKRY